MAQKNKIVINTFLRPRHIRPVGITLIEYYVEAKPNIRWVRIDGPFSKEADAIAVAEDYSSSHPTEMVRVVLEQS